MRTHTKLFLQELQYKIATNSKSKQKLLGLNIVYIEMLP